MNNCKIRDNIPTQIGVSPDIKKLLDKIYEARNKSKTKKDLAAEAIVDLYNKTFPKENLPYPEENEDLPFELNKLELKFKFIYDKKNKEIRERNLKIIRNIAENYNFNVFIYSDKEINGISIREQIINHSLLCNLGSSNVDKVEGEEGFFIFTGYVLTDDMLREMPIKLKGSIAPNYCEVEKEDPNIFGIFTRDDLFEMLFMGYKGSFEKITEVMNNVKKSYARMDRLENFIRESKKDLILKLVLFNNGTVNIENLVK